jgi:hypothetical protein
VDVKILKLNKLIFCQYCLEIYLYNTISAKHIQKHRYEEYKKEIKMYIDE